MIRSFTKENIQKISLGIIFAANLIFFLPYLFTTDAETIGAATGDLPIYFKPMREFAAAQLAQGHFPFWNPYSSGGHPFLADPESGLLYPFTYLFSVLPSHLAFSWNYFIHYLICGYGLFFLCRRLRISNAGSLSAVFIFLFSAPHLLHLYAGHLTMIATLAWTPWLLWSLERFLSTLQWRDAGWFGLFLGLHMLGGFPQYTYFIGWVLIAYGLYACFAKKLFPKFLVIFARLGCGILLGGGLFLTQAGLTKELVDHSTRKNNDFAFVSSYSLSKENLITLLVPKYFGESAELEPGEKTYFGETLVWENTCYMGIVALILFFAGLCEWRKSGTGFWFIVFLVSFAVAIGPLTPFFRFCYEFLPGFSLFRGYSKALTVTCLALAILAGKGLDLMASQPGKPWLRNSILIVPLFLLLLSGLSLIAPDSLPFWKEQLLRQLAVWESASGEDQISAHFAVLQNSLLLTTLFAVLAGGLYVFRGRMGNFRGYFSSLLCLLIFVEFFFYAKPYFSPLDFKSFEVPKSLIRPVLDEPVRARIFHDNFLIAILSLGEGVASVGGYENFTLREYSKLASFFNIADLDSKNAYMAINPTLQNMNFYGANYILMHEAPQPSFALQEIASGDIVGTSYVLYKKRGILSRFNIAHRIKPFPIGIEKDYENPSIFGQFVQTMLQEYPETAFVTADTYRRIFPEKIVAPKKPGASESIRVILEESNRLILEVELAGGGVLTVSENYYPGWRGRVDGEEVEVFPANLIMQAMQVPSGRHRVEFYFVPTHFYKSAMVSLFSLLTLIGMILFNPGGQRPPEML